MEKTISALIEGGKATAGPPIGPALGPMGINTSKVVAEINEKTKDFAGTTVPVKIIVNPSTKDYRIEVGTPSVSAMIKKEIMVEKGSSKANEEKVGDITIDQLIKISRAKKDALLSRTPRAALKEVSGTCVTMGVTINGKEPKEIMADINSGMFDAKIEGKEQLKELSKAELEKKKAEAKAVLDAKHKAEEDTKAAAKPAEGEAEEPKKDENAKDVKKEEPAKETPKDKKGKKKK